LIVKNQKNKNVMEIDERGRLIVDAIVLRDREAGKLFLIYIQNNTLKIEEIKN